MKMTRFALVLPLAFAASGAVAADPAPQVPATPEAMAKLMMDFTKNADVLKDPRKFVPFFMAVTEPSFYLALGHQMLEPGQWANMTNSLMSPASYAAWMPLATDPEVYTKWMAAGMDGNFYTALITPLTDPAKLMRWIMAPVDPKALELAMKVLNPQVYLNWMLSPTDPRWLQAGMAPMNPNLYMGWMGTTMNPATYGNMWKGFATYPYTTLPGAMPTPAPAMMPAPMPATAPTWPMLPYGAPPMPR
jgi:hypothetical protein